MAASGCGSSGDEVGTRNAAFPDKKTGEVNCEIVKGEGKGLTSKDGCPDNEEGNKSLSSVKFDRLLQPGTSEKIELKAKDIHATKFVPDRIGLVDMGLSSLPDIVITAFGDSFASGEGAPATNHTRWVDSNIAVDDPRWPAQIERFEDPLWGPLYCHRSPRSTFAVAMEEIARNSFPGVRLAWRSFACSGAVARNLLDTNQVISDRTSLDGVEQDEWVHRPQFAIAEDWLASIGASSSVTYMNIGGNDAGFSDAIKHCVTTWSCEDRHTDVIEGFNAKARNEIPALLNEIDQALTSSEWFSQEGAVVYSVVPNIAFADGRACGEDHDPGNRMQSFPEDELSSAEVDYLWRQIGIPLQSSMRSTANANGWNVVEVDWADHGICSTEPFVNNNVAATATQGADMVDWGIDLSMGNWHPNADGYENWARALEPALIRAIDEQVAADTEIVAVSLDGPNLFYEYSLNALNDGGIFSYIQRSTNVLGVNVTCQDGRSSSHRYDYVFDPVSADQGGEIVKVQPCGQMQIAEVTLKQKNCFLGEMHWCGEDGMGSARQEVEPMLRAEDLEQNELEVRIGD